MGEPEGLLIEGARLAGSAARDLWRRRVPPTERPVLALERVRARLELYVHALAGRALVIVAADPPPAPAWLARVMGRAPRHLVPSVALAATDGARIWLPRALDAAGGAARAEVAYRLLAVEQAVRAARGTAGQAPSGDAGRVERDLHLLAEAGAVDAAIARDCPGLVDELRAARRAALAVRPAEARLTVAERLVEQLVRAALAADPADDASIGWHDGATPLPPLSPLPAPQASASWARGAARRVMAGRRGYRGCAPVALWGRIETAAPSLGTPVSADGADDAASGHRPRTARLRRRPAARAPREDEDDERQGMWMVRFDEPMESAEDPMGLQRPADRDEAADPHELADAVSDLPELRLVRTPGTPREVLDGDAPTAPAPGAARREIEGAGIAYPEWDYRAGAYRTPGAVVWPSVAPAGGAAWVERMLARHGALVRQVRRRFETLRSRRVRLTRQPDGDELDLAAYVAAFADGRAGHARDDRLYTAERRGRRELAIALLVDVSASTDGWVADDRRIVDVEKEALAVLIEALDALGDRHAVLAFSGQGPERVRVLEVKRFDEALGPEVRRRIAALEPDGYTRVGAAIRHATAVLAAQRVRHQLLLILSDGKPNDVDDYGGRHGIEDTRQAVAEARLQGVTPFALTVDRQAAQYLPSIFGRGGYALLHRPERLPTVLLDIVRRLVAAAT